MKTWNARARLLASVGLMALPLLILAWVTSDGFSSASRIEEPALALKESETATAENGDAELMVLGEPAKRAAAADDVEHMGPAPVESTLPDRVAAEPTLIQAEKSPLASEPDGAEPVAWPPPPVGSISGSLVPDSGVFGGDAATFLQGITLDLVSREEPHVTRVAQLNPILDPDGRLVRMDFVAADLPALEFELTLSTLDRRRWYPETVLVLPPAEGVEFRCFNNDPTVGLEFEVVDAATGDPVEGWSAEQFRMSVSPENGVLLHAGPLSLDDFPIESPLEWIIVADGYAPAFGDERAFSVDPDTGHWRARVQLHKGLGLRLVVLAPNPELRPAAGALVELDGQSVGTTGASGQLSLGPMEPPTLTRISWNGLESKGSFDEVCLRKRSYLRVAVLRN